MSNGNTPASIWNRQPGSRIGRIGDWSGGDGSGTPGRIATLSSLSSSGPVRPQQLSDDEDDEGASKEGESWFAGGERSGISVQNPGSRDPGPRVVQDILRRAAETSAARTSHPDHGDSPSLVFRGGGHTLGSDEVESTYIPDPDVPDEAEVEVAQRNITFWRNGFSVEDGDRLSRAPVSVLNVRPGQPVEVVVSKRVSEDYVPEKRPAKAFSGSGVRLGSPVPTFVHGASTSVTMPGSFPSASSSSAATRSPPPARERIDTLFSVDQTQPTTTVQVRLADGTRMNHTHTVGDIRNFINAARPENLSRPYAIMTTFPNRVLDNDSQTIKDAGLINSVVVQRWV
ncbi:ubiquitin-related domain-containing protein [Pisolithus sp. B1]|nr:ubiquitin-related domain-containing protein [Pisolithus sp. B1]